MIRCVVEMFGLARNVSEIQKVEIELEDRLGLRDVVAELRRAVPSLVGDVICPSENKLTGFYAFNINGRFYGDSEELKLKNGDRIGLLAIVDGG